jgi:15-cis-phytoene synthase
MKELFDQVSYTCSKITTKTYSTSFSMGIFCLDKKFREPIYNIYGFVRFADEIVDSFHGYDKEYLLNDFKKQTFEAIEYKISLNPILNSFQDVVRKYRIEKELIESFLYSMEVDLYKNSHTNSTYENYIYGSAEVVGLMCLKVFAEGDNDVFERLKDPAKKLGAAFQKVNFLRDLNADYIGLGRTYFPGVDLTEFNQDNKKKIEEDIVKDFEEAFDGIKKLPKGARGGVYLAYVYYKSLFQKIRSVSGMQLMNERIRIPNNKKLGLLVESYIKHSLNLL